MTPDIRQGAVQARASHYYDVMRTTMLVFVGVAAIEAFAPGGYSAPLTMLAIAATAYGILAGGTALQDLEALMKDMDDETAKTNYGQGAKARNMGALRTISAALIGLIGLAELYAIFT